MMINAFNTVQQSYKIHEEIGENSRRIRNLKLFINRYNSKGMNYLSENDDWKKFQQLLLMWHMLQNEYIYIYIYISCLNFKTQLKSWKKCTFNDSN